jgi:hypothetical protein
VWSTGRCGASHAGFKLQLADVLKYVTLMLVQCLCGCCFTALLLLLLLRGYTVFNSGHLGVEYVGTLIDCVRTTISHQPAVRISCRLPGELQLPSSRQSSLCLQRVFTVTCLCGHEASPLPAPHHMSFQLLQCHNTSFRRGPAL